MSAGAWFLPFADPGGNSSPPELLGRPWGQGTEYASRAKSAVYPLDTGCTVTPIIGGYWAMSAIRDSLLTCLNAANASSKPAGQKGLVYLAGWRCNPLRDLSATNTWETSAWMNGNLPYQEADTQDQTVLGLLLALIASGVRVRVLLWMPTYVQTTIADHGPEHLYLACAIKKANEQARSDLSTTEDLGVVCLDARVAESAITVAAHHQKMCVVRFADSTDPVAYVGGVDLAYTRRDAPIVPSLHQRGESPTAFYSGDWQSGDNSAGTSSSPPLGTPAIADSWPFGDATSKAPLDQIGNLKKPRYRPKSDLNAAVYGPYRQQWHDQHLQMTGPIVATIEQQFCERWVDAGSVGVIADDIAASGFTPGQGDAYFSSEHAVVKDIDRDLNTVLALPPAEKVDPIPDATSDVQMWRTIPVRPRGGAALFAHGEFTVMAGYSNAISNAQKLIFICDQYFWSVPTARLLGQQLAAKPDLAVVIILPPHADGSDNWWKPIASATHQARLNAFNAMTAGLTTDARARVGVFNAWNPLQHVDGVEVANKGVYVHAKSHVYDGELLVCGSANINRRSFTGDSELAVAVRDPALAANHLRALFTLFSGGAPWPKNADGNPYDPSSDPGPTFLKALSVAPTPNLIIDPQFLNPTEDDFTLPNGAQRGTHTFPMPFSVLYGGMESSSLKTKAIEGDHRDLAQVSAAVENLATYEQIGRGRLGDSRADASQPLMMGTP